MLFLETIWYYYEGFPLNKLLAILSFYTNFTQFSVVVYQVWSIIEGFLWNQQSLPLKRFQTFLVYACFIVAISFWSIYLIQPDAVISKRHPISNYILLTFHGGSFLYLYFITIYTSSIQYSGNAKIVTISGCLYVLFIVLNYLVNDRVPYPFFRHMNPLLAILIIALSVFMISSLYVFVCKRYHQKKSLEEENKNKLY
ncbi:unnamed protein product (macronuclear) [Paramecium tetraurelia]|uniref:THH1/TOM1/TOM3 domain-containing protein n=1 Tax=Paramecium tetraurelia TaxID=5888 RepID=A0CR38_PARTE|nr:uncharacterized protein GSPATT00009569001 [Paramecium tetraurelia]CAK73255.1 unnamed protein product [Paramecium tetraurelia]|eukprot:XP_001440652.1 hypothetical protein (macronuclear) [Paramecium tetraurelia strain d4-2]